MSMSNGEKLPVPRRQQAVQTLQELLAARASDAAAKRQVAEHYCVSARTARTWLRAAYEEMLAASQVDRGKLVALVQGVAPRRCAAAGGSHENVLFPSPLPSLLCRLVVSRRIRRCEKGFF